MELGRECLKLWGYDRIDELIWVKTNQLQRIIRTGRTGHWLNHGKEHCLVCGKSSINPVEYYQVLVLMHLFCALSSIKDVSLLVNRQNICGNGTGTGTRMGHYIL